MLRWYGYLGLLLIILAEINFYAVVQPFATWYIVIIWSGFILFVDSLVYGIRGKSIISSYPKEFVFMLLISVPFWMVFEFYNLFTMSWHYVNYVWYVHLFDFATILPAVLETFSLFNALNIGKRFDARKISKWKNIDRNGIAVRIFAVLGFLATLSPIFLGPIGFVFMWVGLCLLFDPLNYITHRPSLLQKAGTGKKSTLIQICLAGVVMGFFWEFWNYQAYPQWFYTLPQIIINVKLFEMPLEGYIGYIPFGAAVFLFYAFFRAFIFKKGNDVLSM